MRGPEAVEEVQEGHPWFESRRLGNEAEVHGLLNVFGAEHAEARGARRHDIRMVVENGETLARKAAGRNMEDGRRELAGDLVNVRHDEQQPLGSGYRGGEGEI